MLRAQPIRRFLFATGLVFAAGVGAQAQSAPASNLPPTPPTSASAANQIAPLSATPTQPDAATRAHRAEVRYDSGLLSVNANNSSLNQILREIARQTGMKITGGVREERVFGHYGPASPSDILATLIDRTSTNMILRQTASNAPEELILTPRNGGPSPPNPNAPGFDNNAGGDDDERPALPQRNVSPMSLPLPARPPGRAPNPGSVPPSIPQPANNVNGSPFNTSPTASTLPVTNSVPTDSLPTPSTTPSTDGIVDAPNPPPAGTVDPATPNTPKTPEDIYKQLQQLRQQQQQSNPK